MSPAPGSIIRIESFKHDHSLHRIWDKTTLIHSSDAVVIGGNDRVKVTEADGREWRTREPAICTFGRGQWFNTIAMIRDDGIYYYCNIGSPFSLKGNLLSYIDYDLDVKVFPDMTYTILDEEEFLLAQQADELPSVCRRTRTDRSAGSAGLGPFAAWPFSKRICPTLVRALPFGAR
jgi:protein associated with RNAse G/E